MLLGMSLLASAYATASGEPRAIASMIKVSFCGFVDERPQLVYLTPVISRGVLGHHWALIDPRTGLPRWEASPADLLPTGSRVTGKRIPNPWKPLLIGLSAPDRPMLGLRSPVDSKGGLGSGLTTPRSHSESNTLYPERPSLEKPFFKRSSTPIAPQPEF